MNSREMLEDVEPLRTGMARSSWSPYLSNVLVALVFVVLAVRLFRLISKYAVNIFFSDQWKFDDATLFQIHSIWQMFTWQHGPHRQGLGALFQRLIEPYFRWNSRIESFVVGGVVVVAALFALYLKKRLYGHLSASDVLIPAVFFIPRQFETLFVTANFAHGPFPLLLLVLYCLAWTCSKPLVRYALVVLINFVTIYTGFGLLLGFLTPILMILDYRASLPESRLPKGYFICAIAVSLVSIGSFFVGYQFNPGSSCSPFPAAKPQYYIAYTALMFANFFGVKHATPNRELVVGIAAMIALLAALLVCSRQLVRTQDVNVPDIRRKRSFVIASLIAYCFLFCLMTAFGRLCSGLWTAHAPRYVIYLELGVLGLYFHLLNISRTSVRRILLAALLIPVLAVSWRINPADAGHFALIKQQWKTCYLQTENVDGCNTAVGFSIYPPVGVSISPSARQRFQEKLDYLKKNRLNLYADLSK
jgi:hypothetical protein